jgi:hypothetical protein
MINAYQCTNNSVHSDDLLFKAMCDLCGGGFEWKNFILALFFSLLIIVEGFDSLRSFETKEQKSEKWSSKVVKNGKGRVVKLAHRMDI